MTTQQDVIKKFMAALDTTVNAGEAALDEALAACSNFTSYESFLEQLLSDVDTAGSADNFLKNYCGIVLDNEDTGAITGSDAGGSTVKTAESIVPESGTLKNFTGDEFTANGLTVKLGQVNSSGKTVARSFSDLDEQEIYLWQSIYTWWITNALDLISESYGDNYSFTDKSSAVTKTMYVVFANEGAGALAVTWGGPGYAQKCTNDLKLHVNLYYYNTATGENGAPKSNQSYLDRTIAHELTHAVMRANIDFFDYLPAFIAEGMAELTHGIDDNRTTSIKKLAGSSSLLRQALVLDTSNVSVSGISSASYAGGYIFLRYLAYQNADSTAEVDDAETLTLTNAAASPVTVSAAIKTVDASRRTTAVKITGNALDNTIFGGSGADTLDGAAGDDVLTGGNGADVFLWSAGNDTVTDYGTGADKLSIVGGRWSVDGNNFVFSDDGRTLTLTDAADKKISVVSGGVTKIYGADGIFNAAGTAVTVNPSTKNFTADSNVVTIDAGLTDGINLRGNSKSNKISFGDGADVFLWSKGDGNDTLENFSTDDLISVTGAQVSDGSVSSGNTYLKVGTNNLTVKKSSEVTFTDGGDTKIFSDGIFYDTDKTSATLGTSIKDFDAADSDVVNVVGNDKANKLTAAQDVTLTGGKGNDTFVYAAGDVTITDYGTGTDKISLGSAVKSFAADEDVVLDTDGGSLTIQNGADKKITLVSGGKSNVNVFTADGIFNSGKTAVTLNSSAETFTADSKLVSIDASLTDGINLRGNVKANKISFGDGADVFLWSKGDGNDTLENFSSDDLISVTGAQVSDGSVSSGNTYLKVGTNKITVKDSSQVSFDDDGDTKIFSDGIFYDADKTSATLGTSIKNFDAADDIVDVTGNDKANKLTAAQDVTLTGGKGNDTFAHAAGDVTITDYGTGADKISLGSAVKGFAADGDDVIIGDDNGSVIVVDAVDKKVTLVSGGKSNVNIFTADGMFNATKTAVTLNSSAETFTADSKLVSIDAGLTDGINLRGNSKSNKISFGDGADVFLWSKGDGNDTLENFSTDDLISVTGAQVSDGSVSSGNIYLKVGTNKITVKDSSQVTFDDDGDTKIFSDGIFYDADKTSATLGSAIKDFDATGTDVVDVTGNSKANKIYASDTGTTLNGGTGNDSLWGGAGVDTFVYTAGSGNDTICGYESGELLSILGKDGNAGTFTRATFGNSKLTLAISGGGNVIFSGVTDATNFNINNTTYTVDNKTLTKD